MAKITHEYIRRQFLRQFRHMSADRREGTIEALQVIHEEKLAEEVPPEDTGQPALPLEEPEEISEVRP